MKKYGVTGGVKDMFSSLSSSMPDNNQYRPLKNIVWAVEKNTEKSHVLIVAQE